MKVPTIGPAATQAPQRARPTAPAGAARFADHLEKSGESEPEAVAAVGTLTGLSAVLAMQEMGDEGERAARRQLARRGEDLLDRLEEIRHDILMGGVPRARLETLAQTLRARRTTVSDPRLIQILDEIELRAAVEIAKLTR